MQNNTQEKIENKIIDYIALGSDGRLVVVKPEKSERTLIVEKKGDYKEKVIRLEVYWSSARGSVDVWEEINSDDMAGYFEDIENSYLLFVLFDAVKQDLGDNFWVIPYVELDKMKKGDDLSEYLVNKKDFARFLISKI